jgi:hypothetical protein
MSLNSNSNSHNGNNNNNGIGNNIHNANNSQGLFTNFLDNSNNNTPSMNMSRQGTPSSSGQQHPANQVNGTGMAGMGMNMPMNAGHQMDLNHLYEMVLELSDVLKNNRDMTKGIISSAEEIMVSVIACLFWCFSHIFYGVTAVF